MQQQSGLILSQDPAVRMQQLQQHPEITSPGYPMMQVSWSQQAALVQYSSWTRSRDRWLLCLVASVNAV